MNPKFKTKIPQRVLVDSRFISIIHFLKRIHLNSAIYLVRLVTGFNLVVSKNYINKTDIIYKNCKNKLQVYDFKL